MRKCRTVGGTLLSGLLLLLGPARLWAQEDDVTDLQVQTSVDRAIAHLRRTQAGDGHWNSAMRGGGTALAVLALVTAGVKPDDPAVDRGVRALLATPNTHTYVVALKAMALAAVDPQKHSRAIQRCADDLIAGQLSTGTWSYQSPQPGFARGMPRGGMGDNSNTQFALLGLYEARRVGARVPADVFERSDKHFRTTQNADGSWPYFGRAGPANGTNTMTAAGVASLFITTGAVNRSAERGFVDGAAPNCGKTLADVNIAAGLAWLDARFERDVRFINYYWYYAFERIGVLTGMRYIGGVDWFRVGAARLVASQNGDGSWTTNPPDNAFALLFLAKGKLPVVANKLVHRGGWNSDPDDLKNLCVYANQLRVFEEPIGWQTVRDEDSVERWAEAPLLYLTGHEFPELTEDQVGKLKRFLENGGTLFVEACCSRPIFDAAFRAFCRRAFPDYPLNKLDDTHPVYHSHFDLSDAPPVLFGLDLNCRTSVLYSPRDYSCLWQQNALDDATLSAVSETAFRMGTNLLAYAAGKDTLRGRLAKVNLPEARRRPEGTPKETPTVRGAVHFAQLQHSADWRPCTLAVPNLVGGLRDRAGVDVVARAEPMRPDDPALYSHPLAFITGHNRFELSAAEKNALRQYLKRGGFLLAESCCGRPGFDQSFRGLMKELFPEPEATLRVVPEDHPLITGRAADGAAFGFDLRSVTYRKAVKREDPKLSKPVLLMVEIAGRPAVVYSPYSIGCGLDGMSCMNCRGLEPDDCRKLGINIVLWALSR